MPAHYHFMEFLLWECFYLPGWLWFVWDDNVTGGCQSPASTCTWPMMLAAANPCDAIHRIVRAGPTRIWAEINVHPVWSSFKQ